MVWVVGGVKLIPGLANVASGQCAYPIALLSISCSLNRSDTKNGC